MIRAMIFATSLLNSIAAVAHQCEDAALPGGLPGDVFSPTQITVTRMKDKGAWDLRWMTLPNGDVRLVVVQPSTLLVREINPTSGAIVNEKHFADGPKFNQDLSVAAAASGEILIATVRSQEQAIDLFSTKAEARLTAQIDGLIRDAQVVTLNGGRDVLVIANTASEIIVFKRFENSLREVDRLQSKAMLRKVNLLWSDNGQFTLAFHGSDQKVQIYTGTTSGKLELATAFVQLGGRISAAAKEGKLIVASVEGSPAGAQVKGFAAWSGAHSKNVDLGLIVGSTLIDWTSSSPQLIAPVPRDARTLLNRVDLVGGSIVDQLPAGDSRAVTELRSFNLGPKSYYAFISDGQNLNVVSENESTRVSAPEGTRIAKISEAVRLADGRKMIAVLGEGANGASVSFIQLNKGN